MNEEGGEGEPGEGSLSLSLSFQALDVQWWIGSPTPRIPHPLPTSTPPHPFLASDGGHRNQ